MSAKTIELSEQSIDQPRSGPYRERNSQSVGRRRQSSRRHGLMAGVSHTTVNRQLSGTDVPEIGTHVPPARPHGVRDDRDRSANPSLRLVRYRPFSTGAVAARTAETPSGATAVTEELAPQ